MAPVILDSLLKVIEIDGQRHLDWRRYVHRTPEPKPSLCQAPDCPNGIDQPRYGRTRLYCSDACAERTRRARIRAGITPQATTPKVAGPEPDGGWGALDYGWTKARGWPSKEQFDRYMRGEAPLVYTQNGRITVAAGPPGTGAEKAPEAQVRPRMVRGGGGRLLVYDEEP